MQKRTSIKRQLSRYLSFILFILSVSLVILTSPQMSQTIAATPDAIAQRPFSRPSSEVVTYPAPRGATAATDFRVKVNGRDTFVYDVNPTKTMEDAPPRAPFALDPGAMTYFDMDGSVTVEITANGPIRRIDIRPKALGLQARVSGRTATITLDRPAKFGIEINGNKGRPLFIFANAIENNAPRAGNPAVLEYRGGGIPPASSFRTLYFGPGIHNIGNVELRGYNDKLFYFAGGAIVRGGLVFRDSHNLTVRGRGIFWNSESVDRQATLWAMDCTNVTLDGITFVNNAPQWTLNWVRSNNLTARNINVLSSRHTGDGLDVNGSQNARIEDAFFVTNDDAIAIKANRLGQDRPVRNITIQNSALWFGTLDIGFETRTNEIKRVTVRNMDVIHKTPRGDAGGNETLYRAALKVNNSDRATIRDVQFDNIRIEDPMSNLLFAVRVFHSYASHNPYRPGRVKDIHFRNIQVIDAANVPPSLVKGHSQGHLVEDVTFEDISINGVKLRDLSRFKVNEFVDDIRLKDGCCRTLSAS